MTFSLVTVHVRDMERSLEFYHGLLGLPVRRRQPTPHGELAFLGGDGGVQLELVAGGDSPGHSGFSLGFDVEDLQAAADRLAGAGFPLVKGPFSPGPGTTLAFLAGPDGEEVELIHYD